MRTRRLTNVQATLAAGCRFHDFVFTYDTVGNVTSLENKALPPGSFPGPGLGNAIGGPWLKTYAYDDLYRMTTSAGRHETRWWHVGLAWQPIEPSIVSSSSTIWWGREKIRYSA